MGKKLSEYTQDEMVELLRSDVAEWNRLVRGEKPGFRPELNYANFPFTNLTGANLKHASLWSARFYRANLSRANFLNAGLTYADLRGADLRGASLAQANLTNTDLTGADLTGVDLTGANLDSTNLTDAKLDDIRGRFSIHPSTVILSSPLPPNFLKVTGIGEHFLSALNANTSTVTITFTREVWGQLLPIESALSSFLDDRYVIEKGKDRITVQVPSPQLVEDTLQAIMPVLASLQREAPGNLEGLEVLPEGGEKETLTEERLIEVLQAFGAELTSQLKGPALTTSEEVALEYYKKIPGVGPSHPILRKAFERRSEQPSKVQRIFQRFTNFFRATNEVMAIAEGESPKQLGKPGEQGEGG